MNEDKFIKSMEILKELYDKYDALSSYLKLCPENTISELYGEFKDLCVGLLEEIAQDKNDWVSWFIYDNDFGRKGLEAGRDGNMEAVKTPSDLIRIIKQ